MIAFRYTVMRLMIFAGFFALAAAATWGLPERRGEPLAESLEDTVDTGR